MWGQGDLVSPVADRDSRDQEKRDKRVVQMASVRNKTAELAEGWLKNSRVPLALFLQTDRMARVLLGRWVEDGWLEVADPPRRARAYVLSASYRQVIGNSSEVYRQWVVGDCDLIEGRSQPRKPSNIPQPPQPSPQSEETRRA